VYGRDAAALVAAAEANGNIRVHFGGRFTIVDFERQDGSHGRAYEVDADLVAVGLGQDVALTKGAGRDASESWGSAPDGYGEEPAGWADQHCDEVGEGRHIFWAALPTRRPSKGEMRQ